MAIHIVTVPVRDYKNRIARSSKHFVGRDKELKQLDTFLCDTPRIPRQAQMVDIHALGGQGKTQLALRYIQLYGYKFEPIFWVDGTSTESIQKSYAKIASVLGYPQVGAMLTARDDVHRFLNDRSNPWLLVYDNVDNEACWDDIQNNHPHGPGSHIILTTRLNSTEERMHIPLKPLSEEAAVELLLNKGGLNESELNKSGSSNEQAARAIARRMGCLALGLSFAAAYIAMGRCTIEKYLGKFDSFHHSESRAGAAAIPRRTDSELDRGPPSIEIKKDEPVFVAFGLSYDVLGKTANSTKLLQLFGFLNGNSITSAFLASACTTKKRYNSNGILETVTPQEDGVPEWLVKELASESGSWKDSNLLDLTQPLVNLSLLEMEHVGEEVEYSVHPLVHEFLRHRIPGNTDKNQMQQEALNIIDHSIPEEDDIRFPHEFHSHILPHIQHYHETLVDLLRPSEPESKDKHASKLLYIGYRFGCVLETQFRFEESKTLLQLAHERMKERLGEAHSDTLMAANAIAVVLFYRNSVPEQVEWLRMLCEQIPVNTVALFYAARCYSVLLFRLGFIKSAMGLGELAVDGFSNLLGPSHPFTLVTRYGLASSYMSIPGRDAEALAFSEKTDEAYVKRFGPSSLSTLFSFAITAIANLQMQRIDAAQTIAQKVVEGCEATGNRNSQWGHCALLTLASCKVQQGQYEEALRLAEECYENSLKSLGEDNMDTQMACIAVTTALIHMNLLDEAEELIVPSLDRMIRVVGPDATSVVTATYTAGLLFVRKGSFKKAESYLKMCMDAYSKNISPKLEGKNEPCYKLLKEIYEVTGRAEDAEELHRRFNQVITLTSESAAKRSFS
jgi:tetratricopeptide (TPR) repeat protein